MSHWAHLLSIAAKVNLLVLVVSVVFSWSSQSDRVPVSVDCSGQGLSSLWGLWGETAFPDPSIGSSGV